MSSKKQPYIPFYTGDYLKDTRSLTLAAKGAWTDLIIFMWNNATRGILEGNLQDFARMIGGTEEETRAVLLELCLKGICDKAETPGGRMRITCRRLVREAALSETRAAVGSKGGSKTAAKHQAKEPAKSEQNPDSDNDNAIEIRLKEALDSRTIEIREMQYASRGVNVKQEALNFRTKVLGADTEYADRSAKKLRLAFDYHLRNTKPTTTNGNNTSKKQQQLASLVADYASIHGEAPAGGNAAGI